MKVVIDTNVFVSGFFGGNPKSVLDLLDAGRIKLCISPLIAEEYFRIFQRMGRTSADLEKLMFLCSDADTIEDIEQTPQIHLVKADPDDDKYIECAAALNAGYIITGDKALLEVGHYKKTRIVTPKQFLDIFHTIK